MRELKVGMRGRVYGYAVNVDQAHCWFDGAKAEVNFVYPEESQLVVKLGNSCNYYTHFRNFVPFKEKKKAAEYWLRKCSELHHEVSTDLSIEPQPKCHKCQVLLVREVREKKK